LRVKIPNWRGFCADLICMQYHPDVNKEPGATDKFKEISNAYEVCIEITLLTVQRD
jgi:hypothetical protein